MDKTRREKLRLLLFEDCNRQCSECCNKYYDLKNLPVETDFTGYREIILTGGEPMLKPLTVIRAIMAIKAQNQAVPIYMYTAYVNEWVAVLYLLYFLDGITVTLHKQADVRPFVKLAKMFPGAGHPYKSMRLSVFKGVVLPTIVGLLRFWAVAEGKVWISEDCLPEGEVFKRLAKA